MSRKSTKKVRGLPPLSKGQNAKGRERKDRQSPPIERTSARELVAEGSMDGGAARVPSPFKRDLIMKATGCLRRVGVWLNLRNVVLLGGLILLFYPPYFRGLFFPREQLITYIITTALFVLWWVYKLRRSDTSFIRGPMDYAALGLVGSYILSTFVAVNIRGAIGEDLKIINYFILYWLVSELVRYSIRTSSKTGQSTVRIILNVMVASALGVAILGLGVAAGTIKYNGAFIDRRIASSIQYPNSLAAYLMAALFLAAGLSIETVSPWKRAYYLGAASVILQVFFLTLSRGAWLTFPVTAALFLFLQPRRCRFIAAFHVGSIIAGSLVSLAIYAKGSTGLSGLIWLSTVAGAITANLITIVAVFVRRQEVKVKLGLLLGIVILLAAAGGVGLWQALSRPLELTHGPSEPDSWKYYQQVLTGARPNSEYILEYTARGQVTGDKPFAWQVEVISLNVESKVTPVLQAFGSNGKWETHRGTFKVPGDAIKVVVKLNNYYQDTKAWFRDIRLKEVGSNEWVGLTFALYKILPRTLAQRLATINLKEYSAEQRLYYFRDGLKIVRDYPFLGVGGAGWQSIYFKYQSFGYWSTLVHNHFLQTWVEAGTVGLLLWLTVWGMFAWRAWRSLRSASKMRVLLGSVTVAAVALGLHSLIDFNLSLSAISFYLWSLWGLTEASRYFSDENGIPVGDSAKQLQGRAISWAASLGFLIPTVLGLEALFLLIGFNHGQQGAILLQQKRLTEARRAFEKALHYDPFTASFHMDLAQIYEAQGQQAGSKVMLALAQDHAKRGVSLDPYNPNFNAVYGALLIRNGDISTGIVALERVVLLQPHQVKNYENLAQAYFQVASYYLEKGNLMEGRKYLEKIPKLRQRLEETKAEEPVNMPVNIQNIVPLSRPLQLLLIEGQARLLLNERGDAENLLLEAAKTKEVAGQALIWLGALYETQGRLVEARKVLDNAWKVEPSLRATYPRILALIEGAQKKE